MPLVVSCPWRGPPWAQTQATATAGCAQSLEGHDVPPWRNPTARHVWVQGDAQLGDGRRTQCGWQVMMGALEAVLRPRNMAQGADAQVHDGHLCLRLHPRQPW